MRGRCKANNKCQYNANTCSLGIILSMLKSAFISLKVQFFIRSNSFFHRDFLITKAKSSRPAAQV